MWSLFLFLTACTGEPKESASPESAPPEESDPPVVDTVETAHTGESATETAETAHSAETAETAHTGDSAPAETAEPLVVDETVDGMDDPAGWLFSDDEVHSIDIYFSEESATALNSDPYSYVEGKIIIDGMTVESVGLRLKGKIGSFRNLYQKAAFKVDFNAYVPDQTFYGLKKLNLNNMVVDCSMVKEHVAYKAFRDAGIAAQRTGYAWVTVNDEPYGLYNILEQPNQELLDRYYADPSGNLYDGKYVYYGGYSYTLLDLRADLVPLYEQEEGTDVDNADVMAVAEALSTYAGTDEFYTAMSDYVDWDEVLTYWAVEQWVGHNDGYALNRNNNFLYFDAADGKMEFIPWDMDYSHLNDSDWGMSWAVPYGLLAMACHNDATCNAAWKEKAQVVVDAMDTTAIQADIDAWSALIKDYAEADPRKECSSINVVYYQGYVSTFVMLRPDYMKTFWDLE